MTKLHFNRKHLCIPYAVFLICFVIAPLLVIVYYAFTNGQGNFTFDNFTNFFYKHKYDRNAVIQLCACDSYDFCMSFNRIPHRLHSGKKQFKEEIRPSFTFYIADVD